jgi:hypothetical protein
MNRTTAAQRYNKRMDSIFATAKILKQQEDNKRKFIGRNIKKEDYLVYITWSENDLQSVYDRRYKKDFFSTYPEALSYMKRLVANGSTWFDAHLDPTL